VAGSDPTFSHSALELAVALRFFKATNLPDFKPMPQRGEKPNPTTLSLVSKEILSNFWHSWSPLLRFGYSMGRFL
jgi:hypothetical protein